MAKKRRLDRHCIDCGNPIGDKATRCDPCSRCHRGIKHRRPLLPGETPTNLRPFFDFENQHIKYSEQKKCWQPEIKVVCPICKSGHWQIVTYIRQDIRAGNYTACCRACSINKARQHRRLALYNFGQCTPIYEKSVRVSAFGSQYIDILRPMALGVNQVLTARAIMAIKEGRPLIGKRDGLAYWEEVHHLSYPSLLDGSNLQLRIVLRNYRQRHLKGTEIPEPMATVLAENARLLVENAHLKQLVHQ